MPLSKPLPTNIAETYVDLGPSAAVHQDHHDSLHVRAEALTEVRYAHPEGSNTNDGLTWGTAKLTVLAAYDSLPSSGGLIEVAGTVDVGGEVANQGLWIADVQDTQYASLPAGWRQAKSVRIRGRGLAAESFQSESQAAINAGHSTDRTKPAVWLSGLVRPIKLEGLHFRYPAVGMKLGIDSAGGLFNNTASIFMDRVTVNLNQATGNGPVFHMGSIYWSSFNRITAGSNCAAYTLTAASITSGTTARFTTSTTHRFAVGDTVDVRNVTPSAYNTGPNVHVPWTITAIGSNTFDADIESSPAPASAFGTARPVESEMRAIFYCPTNCTFDLQDSMLSGGGIVMESPTVGVYSTQFYKNILKEGNWGEWYDPPFWHVRGDLASQALIRIEEIQSADSLLDGEVKVPPDKDYSDRVTVIDSQIAVKGNVTIIGGQSTRSDGPPPQGMQLGQVYGTTPAFRRNFAPSLVRFTNRVSQDASAWAGMGTDTTKTYGVLAPDGTATAANYAVTGGAQGVHSCALAYVSQALAVGDWLLTGCWVRNAGNSYNYQVQFGSGSVNTDNLFAHVASNVLWSSPLIVGGHEWQWVWQAGKFKTIGTPSSALNFTLALSKLDAYPLPSADYWGPVMLYVPVANITSDAEMREYAKHMGTVVEGVTGGEGSISLMGKQNLVLPSGFVEGREISDPSAPGVDSGRMFYRDNGAGKTQLCVRFATGDVQVIATQP